MRKILIAIALMFMTTMGGYVLVAENCPDGSSSWWCASNFKDFLAGLLGDLFTDRDIDLGGGLSVGGFNGIGGVPGDEGYEGGFGVTITYEF